MVPRLRRLSPSFYHLDLSFLLITFSLEGCKQLLDFVSRLRKVISVLLTNPGISTSDVPEDFVASEQVIKLLLLIFTEGIVPFLEFITIGNQQILKPILWISDYVTWSVWSTRCLVRDYDVAHCCLIVLFYYNKLERMHSKHS